jgi:hypothetical protein
MKKQIFDFIKLKTPNIKKVLEVKIKDYDDENGLINEHYEVRCLLRVPDTSIPLENMLGESEKICLVDTQAFNMWIKNESSVKWI